MTNPLTILERSAMPEGVKVATFSSEILRRLKTTSTGISQEESEEIILDMMDDLTAMGYSQQWKEKVLKAAMSGHMRILQKVKVGEASLHRKGKETLKARRFKKLVGATEWFRVEEQDDAREIMAPWEKTGKGRNMRKREGDAR